MNKKGNQRTVQTEQKIKGVFLKLLGEKEFSRISVSEICARADIHRTTFYVHYQDVYDLMEKMVGEMYLEVVAFFVGGEKVLNKKGFLGLFQLILERQNFFRAYLTASKDTKWERRLIPELLAEKAEQLYQMAGYRSEKELYYHQMFFTAGLTALINEWILGGCQEPPEEMSRILAEEYTMDRSWLWRQE